MDLMTDEHNLLQRRITICTLLQKDKNSKIEDESSDENTDATETHRELGLELAENADQLNSILENSTTEYDSPDEIGLTSFHIASTLRDLSVLANLCDTIVDINHKVNENSPLWPGYTALHFAAHCDINAVKMLIMRGAELLTKDAKGITALDICIESYNLRDLSSIIACVTDWRKITFSDKKTKLLCYIDALRSEDRFEKFWNNRDHSKIATLPDDSSLWPGRTFLHIAIDLLKESNLQILEWILQVNRNIVTMQDSRGSTPVHLAFRQKSWKVLELLLKNHKKPVNPLDEDNLSHLHIAAAANNQSLVKKLLDENADCNVVYKGKFELSKVKPGWTPLHTTVHKKFLILSRLLLENGANVMLTDDRGFTPIHLLLASTSGIKRLADLLLASGQLKECVVESIGLTHLHVASYYNNVVAMDVLLRLGSNIEATIGRHDEFLKFEGYRPLHLVSANEALRRLLYEKADILAMAADGFSPLLMALFRQDSTVFSQSSHRFLDIIEDGNELFHQRMQNELGLTRLHIACLKVLNVNYVEEVLKKDIDVNVRINEKASRWPGYTALHLLVYSNLDRQCILPKILKMLINKGADVSLVNKYGDTPMHIILNSHFPTYGLTPVKILLNHYKNYNNNPANKEGITFFHMACLVFDKHTAEQFLLHSTIDVNLPVNKSSERFGGQTPLHMALTAESKRIFGAKSQLQLVDLLLDNGADLRPIDARGWTLLHCVAKCGPKRMELLDRIDRRYASDVNQLTNDRETAFEILLRHGASVEEIKYFIKRGSRVNDHNTISGIGYMALVIATEKYKSSYKEVIDLMMKQPDIIEINPSGRNAIHNAVACRRIRNVEIEARTQEFYISVFERLMELGCKIDHRDNLGKTAFHLAVEFGNEMAVPALLICGAGINVMDNNGLPPLSGCLNAKSVTEQAVMISLCRYLMKLQVLQIDVSQENVRLLNELVRLHGIENFNFDRVNFQRHVEETKAITIAENVKYTLYRILRETIISKQTMGVFVKSYDDEKFDNVADELKFLLQMQYKKFSYRLPLLEPCQDSLRTLLGFPLPDLCVDIVLKFLNNSELSNLIAATEQHD